MKILKYLLFLIGIIFFQNCTKPVDFDQIDNANIEATYITTLIHFNLTAPNFLNESNEEISLTTDVIEIPLSNDSEPYLEKIEFTVITKNTFDRSFALSFVFFDASNTLIYTLNPTIIVPENSSELTTILEIPQEDISVIYNTKYIGVTIILLPSDDGSIININETSEFNLKSSMKLFVNYRKV